MFTYSIPGASEDGVLFPKRIESTIYTTSNHKTPGVQDLSNSMKALEHSLVHYTDNGSNLLTMQELKYSWV
jgi:hypothetical protein